MGGREMEMAGDQYWYCSMSREASFQHLIMSLVFMGLLSCTDCWNSIEESLKKLDCCRSPPSCNERIRRRGWSVLCEFNLYKSVGTIASDSKDGRGRHLEVTTPMTTVPIFNPTNPGMATPAAPVTPPTTPTPATPVTNPYYSTPTMITPPAAATTTGQSWCVASPTAAQTALQVALDYACGYGGADCSGIQQGGSCYNPNTVRDHASYAFNNYYQKNPIPTSCDFGGTAMLTNTDPSTSTCQYPATSMGSSALNTTNPTGPGSNVYGSVPPSASDSAMVSACLPVIFTLACLLITLMRKII